MTLEADGMISVYEIESGETVAQYEGLEVHEEIHRLRQLVAKLLGVAKANEWQVHHAAENHYCPFCVADNEFWEDQKEHHEGCEFVALVAEAERVSGKEIVSEDTS